MSAHLLDCIDDDFNAHVDLRRVCRGCGMFSRNLAQGDGYCHRCNSVGEPTPWEEERRAMERARENTRQAEIRANRRGF